MSSIPQDNNSNIHDPIINESSEFKEPPFELLWVLGHNNSIPAYDISTCTRTGICYVSGSMVIIYDWIKNRQYFLQGHFNDITCMNISKDVQYLTSFDYGKKNSLFIWNLNTRKVLQAFCGFKDNDELPYLEFSCDGSFMILLKSNKSTKENSLYIWNWEFDNEEPQLTYIFSSSLHFGYHHFIATHPQNKYHFLTSSPCKVMFFKVSTTDPISTSAENLPKSNALLNSVDKFNQSVFLTSNLYVISTISNGKFLIWGCLEAFGERIKYNFVEPCNRVPIRLIEPHSKLMNFTSICLYKDWLITGNDQGEIHFYDIDLTIIATYDKISKKPIKRVSFSDGMQNKLYARNKQRKAYVSGNDTLPNFVISTENGYCGWFSTRDDILHDIILGNNQIWSAVTISSALPYICFGDDEGTIQLWNYEKHKIINTKVLDGKCKNIECLDLNPISTYLACGLTDGTVWILDAPSLLTIENISFAISKTKIRLCKFSPNSDYLACVDNEDFLFLFKMGFVYRKNDLSLLSKLRKKIIKWNLIGKTKDHDLPIVDILFDYTQDYETYRIFTLGQDKHLAVYDLNECTLDNIETLAIIKIEQSAIPTCMTWSPFLEESNFLAILSNDCKIKMYDLSRGKCIKMNLLPIYDTPVNQLITITLKEQKFFVLKTNHSIALIILPIDANPRRARAIYVESDNLKKILKDKNDKYIFSFGGIHTCIKMWKINFEAIPDITDDQDISPFLHFASENIREEIINISYALQIQRLSNSFSMDFNLKEEDIMLKDLVNIVTALGYFPTQHEIDILMEDAKALCRNSNDKETNKILSLNDVIKLYVNHRPVKSIESKELIKLFKSVFDLKDQGCITRQSFMEILNNVGESINENEMIKLLTILAGNEPLNEEILQNPFIDCYIQDIYKPRYKGLSDKNKKGKERKNLSVEKFPGLSKSKYSIKQLFFQKETTEAIENLLPPEINENTICELFQYTS